MTIDSTTPLYVIGEDGVHRISATFLGPVDALAARISAQMATRLPNLFGTRHVVKKQTAVFTSEKLTQLRFNTHFTANGDHMVPVFSAGGDSVAATLTWSVPTSMDLRFGLETLLETDNRYYFVNAYLVAKSPRQTGVFRLPLPNVYDDGRICMGNEWSCTPGSLDSVLQASLTQFNNAPWNTDLLRGMLDRAQRLVRFAGTDTVPVEDWETHCIRCSHPSHEYYF